VPSCDNFQPRSSYLNVALTAVHHVYVTVLCCLQLLPVSRVSGERPLLEPSDFVTSFKWLHATDSRAAMLNGDCFSIAHLFRHLLCCS